METVSELRSKAAELRKIADKLESAADALVQLGASNGSGGNLEKLTPFQHLQATVRQDLKNLSGVDAIERVLFESETPLSKDMIAERLRARGKAVGATTLQSYLSREKRFASLGRGQWTTKVQADVKKKLDEI
jgi:hypothetical protein